MHEIVSHVPSSVDVPRHSGSRNCVLGKFSQVLSLPSYWLNANPPIIRGPMSELSEIETPLCIAALICSLIFWELFLLDCWNFKIEPNPAKENPREGCSQYMRMVFLSEGCVRIGSKSRTSNRNEYEKKMASFKVMALSRVFCSPCSKFFSLMASTMWKFTGSKRFGGIKLQSCCKFPCPLRGRKYRIARIYASRKG